MRQKLVAFVLCLCANVAIISIIKVNSLHYIHLSLMINGCVLFILFPLQAGNEPKIIQFVFVKTSANFDYFGVLENGIWNCFEVERFKFILEENRN